MDDGAFSLIVSVLRAVEQSDTRANYEERFTFVLQRARG